MFMPNNEKARKFLIATHGALASGIKSSLEMIIGAVENVFLIQAYMEENKPIEKEIQEIIEQTGDNEELVIFSDILGGSVTNQILQHALKPGIFIVSGFNLPLVMEIILAGNDESPETTIENAIINAREQMVFVNKLVSAENKDEQND